MRIIIYGSSGFVGRYVVERLKDNELILPVRHIEKISNFTEDKKNIKIITYNQDNPGIEILNEKPDIVINLIGILRENPSSGSTFEKVHYELSKALIDQSKKAGVSKFIQMSALGADINSKSRYLKTKAMTERYLINSNLRYVIFRPSIIMGPQQKLFDDLKRYSKIAPFYLAPMDAKVQPVHVLDVADCFKKATNEDISNQIFELCGNKIINFKELFEFALSYLKINRFVIGVPKRSFIFLIPFFQLMPEPIMTWDQYYMLEKDNICSKNYKTVEDLLGKVRDAFVI